jgi:hypothetical protein
LISKGLRVPVEDGSSESLLKHGKVGDVASVVVA